MSTQPQVTPQYIAAYSGYKLVALSIAMIPILCIFVALRFYARHLKKAPWGLDDILVLISLTLQIGSSALAICFVKYGGVGRHFAAWEVIDPGKTTVYFKYLLAVSFYYFFCVAWPKLSILALYARIFAIKSYRIVIIILAVVVAATGIVCSIMSLNLCHPFEYNWNRTTMTGTCVNEQVFYRWGSLPNIVTDVIMLVLPLPIVWRLNTSFNVKTGLTVAFLVGSLGLATSIVRFASFFKGSAVEDGTWASVDLMIWTVIEPDVYLIASCLLTFRPIFVHFRGGKTAPEDSSDSRRKINGINKSGYTYTASARSSEKHMFDQGESGQLKNISNATGLEPKTSFATDEGDTLHEEQDLEPGKIHIHREYDVSVSDT